MDGIQTQCLIIGKNRVRRLDCMSYNNGNGYKPQRKYATDTTVKVKMAEQNRIWRDIRPRQIYEVMGAYKRRG
jgi:hypothetical protein